MVATPTRTQDFVASLGFDTHIAYTDGGYANVANVEADMSYLGISNIRDGISNGSYGSAPISSYIDLAQRGAKFTFIVGAGGAFTTASLQAQLAMFDQVNEAVAGSVVAVEGPNEINNAPLTYNGVGGEPGAIALQTDLYRLVQADANLAGVTVDYFTGYDTVGNAAGPNPATTPGLADFDNQHPYPNFGQAPGFWVNPSFALGNEPAPYGPFVYTETGYSTNSVNADVQARYSLDLLMDAAKDGSAKTFLYQLLDAYRPGSPQGDDGFGLFDPSNTPKPAALGIHNLVAILRDPGTTATTFTPIASAATVSGLSSTGNSMVLAKSDGTQDIVAWDEKPLWDNANGAELTPANTSAAVSLGATYGTVNVYDPLAGAAPIATYSNASSVTLALGASPLIVEALPQAAPSSNLPVTYNWDPSTQLSHFIAAGTHATIETVGDSTTLGFGSAATNYRALSYPTDLAADLSAAGIAAQSDNFTGLDAGFDSRVTFVGGATFAEPQVPGGYNIGADAAGQGFDFTLPTPAAYDHVSVSYIDAGGGSFTVSVDGGAALGAVHVGASFGTKTATFAVPLGMHDEISVRATNSSTLYLEGAAFSNAASPSVSVINAGIGGATAPSNVDSGGNPATAFGKLAGDVAYAPDLVLIDYGINDIGNGVPLSQTIAADETMIGTFKAAGADPVLVIPEPISGTAFASQIGAFRSAIEALAVRENVGVIDLSATYGDDWAKLQAAGELGGDNLHPNAAGYADIALKDANLLAPLISRAGSAPVLTPAPSSVYAASYTEALSAASETQSTPVTVTYTPVGGAWQPGEVITPTVANIAGTFGPTTLNASGTAPVSTVFTPASIGTGIIAATTSTSMTNSTGPLSDASIAVAGPQPIVLGSGPDTLALSISEDAWQGDARFTVSVDGAQVGGALTATSLHSANVDQVFDIEGDFAGSHTASIDFLNDAWGGTPTTDRNLYVDGASIDSAVVPGGHLTLLSGGPQSFAFQEPSTGSAGQPVNLLMSEDAWMGDAQFAVSVNGARIGGVQTETATHGVAADAFSLGTLGPGTYDVAVEFLNDAWGGTPATDRNLYVDGATVGGVAQPGASLALYCGGVQHLSVVVPGH